MSRDGAGRTIAGRYSLRARIGRGGHGDVWEAEDSLTGALVAVKILRRREGDAPARARREVLALRMLRIPGVVQMLDEGSDQGDPFLVMERAFGEPFPGGAARSWAAIAGPTEALLGALARVHAAGVVHCDIKPGNVLVNDGRATILDFGLALAPSIERGRRTLGGETDLEGTPAYLAPEQILAEPVTPATDLYAVGVMLYEALSGRLPHAAADFQGLMRARLLERAPPLRSAAPSVPRAAASLVDWLLARSPEERPRSAAEWIHRSREQARASSGEGAIFGSGPPATVAPPSDDAAEVWALPRLRALFEGPDRIFHFSEDAARELFARTEGRPQRVAEELASWERAGLAQRAGSRWIVGREAIERLSVGRTALPAPPSPKLSVGARRSAHRAAAKALPRGAPGKLFHLIAGQSDREPTDPAEIAEETLALAEPLAVDGHVGRATTLLSDGLCAARREAQDRDEDWGEARILGLWAQLALSDGTPGALDRALYEVCRSTSRAGEIEAIGALLRAAVTMRTTAGERALSLVEGLDPFHRPDLERARQQVRVLAARRCAVEREEAVLNHVEAWARGAGARAEVALADWLGRLRYRQGRFAEAAALHAQAAAGEPWATARLGALLNAASAQLEAFQFDDAFEAAERARALAASCRHSYCEARAEWLSRSARYRRGDVMTVDEELIELGAKLGVVDLEALLCLNEAAVAWRSPGSDRAAALARRAERLWTSIGKTWGALFARTLAISREGAAIEEARSLLSAAERCPVPGAGVQMLGLLAEARPDMLSELASALHALQSTIPARARGWRMDVMSVEEAFQRVHRAAFDVEGGGPS